MFIHQEILLASPVSVAARLISLLPEPSFWRAVLFSFSRITLGFSGLPHRDSSGRACLPFLLGPGAHPASDGRYQGHPLWLRSSFWCLSGCASRHLSIFISLLMVTPIIYSTPWRALGTWIRSFWKWRMYLKCRSGGVCGISIFPRCFPSFAQPVRYP